MFPSDTADERVHQAYLICDIYRLTHKIAPVCASLYCRKSGVNPDVIIYLFAIQALRHTVANITVPPDIYHDLEIKPIITKQENQSIYQFIKDYSEGFLKKPTSRKGEWINIHPHKEVFDSFPDTDHEGMYEFCFPGRTPADLGIRNIRFQDIRIAYDNMNCENDF
jgi:hypothetical protein